MPSQLTIFAAKYLIYLDAALAAAGLLLLLLPRPRVHTLRWLVLAAVIVVLSLVLAQIAAAVYTDPRPFAQDHVRPLIPHAADNGFPSDHALLAAALVALVLVVDPVWALPFAALAVLVDWARVGAGIHHVQDVLGSTVLVALATGVALLVAPAAVRVLTSVLPAGWTEEPIWRRTTTSSDV